MDKRISREKKRENLFFALKELFLPLLFPISLLVITDQVAHSKSPHSAPVLLLLPTQLYHQQDLMMTSMTTRRLWGWNTGHKNKTNTTSCMCLTAWRWHDTSHVVVYMTTWCSQVICYSLLPMSQAISGTSSLVKTEGPHHRLSSLFSLTHQKDKILMTYSRSEADKLIRDETRDLNFRWWFEVRRTCGSNGGHSSKSLLQSICVLLKLMMVHEASFWGWTQDVYFKCGQHMV